VSGWLYAPWRGHFYPAKLPQRRELEYAAGIFKSIEINGSFYSLQRRESWQRWYAETPDDFVFAVKGSRYLTHMLRLRDAERALANFFAQGVLALKQKLGPILWQLPPQMSFDPQRIDEFLYALPRDTGGALSLARGHDARLAEREYLEIDTVRPLRHAMEIRHRSFVDPRFIAMLRKHNVALVVAETAQRWPLPCDVTADFVYLRFHGPDALESPYRGTYGPRRLWRWERRCRGWLDHGLDVYAYFNNDWYGSAVTDATWLRDALARGVSGARTG